MERDSRLLDTVAETRAVVASLDARFPESRGQCYVQTETGNIKCLICDMWLANEGQFSDHLRGYKHRKKAGLPTSERAEVETDHELKKQLWAVSATTGTTTATVADEIVD